MLDFTYEILDSATINVQILYGGEWFEFNLFHKQEQWILHPFNAILLGNPEMCRLVLTDLFANKPFQVMLAKERIRLSNLRTSIDVTGERDDRQPDRPDEQAAAKDPIDEWIESHSLEEIVREELQGLEHRQQLFNSLLQKMFYHNLGPGEEEFDKVQVIARAYKDAAAKLSALINPDDYSRDINANKRRF